MDLSINRFHRFHIFSAITYLVREKEWDNQRESEILLIIQILAFFLAWANFSLFTCNKCCLVLCHFFWILFCDDIYFCINLFTKKSRNSLSNIWLRKSAQIHTKIIFNNLLFFLKNSESRKWLNTKKLYYKLQINWSRINEFKI